MKLQGKVALITGSGRGLGRAMALAFAREGADVAVVALHSGTAGEVAATIVNDFKRRAIAISADVSKKADVDAMVDRTLTDLGRIDILVNNAGVNQALIPTLEQSVEDWDRVIAVHLRGTYLCSQRVGKWMVSQSAGTILNMASVVGMGGAPMRTSYGPAKAGIINLTQVLAVEWAGYNIRVNCLAPAFFDTPMLEHSLKTGKLNLEAIQRRTPLGRLGRLDELMNAAVFLVSDEASYITGVVLPVDGGWLAHRYM